MFDANASGKSNGIRANVRKIRYLPFVNGIGFVRADEGGVNGWAGLEVFGLFPTFLSQWS